MVAQRQAGCIPIACPTDCPQKLYAEAEAGVAAAAEAEAEAGAEAEADAIAIVMVVPCCFLHRSRTAGAAQSTARDPPPAAGPNSMCDCNGSFKEDDNSEQPIICTPL